MIPRSITGMRRRIFLGLGGAAVAFGLPQGAVRAQNRSVPAPDAYADIQHGQTVFIDTRSAAEKSAGSPAGVTAEITYPMDSSQDERFIADVLKATGGRRDVSVTLICTSGVRSAQAQAVLERNGFTRARSIDGGFGGWQRSGLPHSTAK